MACNKYYESQEFKLQNYYHQCIGEGIQEDTLIFFQILKECNLGKASPFQIVITARKRSCGKVMFSAARVCLLTRVRGPHVTIT